MALIEVRRPDGRIIELLEVDLTQSGLLIVITDCEGNRAYIHRYAWDGLIDAVNFLFEQEDRVTEVSVQQHLSKQRGGQ
jgi:hypothetical protein